MAKAHGFNLHTEPASREVSIQETAILAWPLWILKRRLTEYRYIGVDNGLIQVIQSMYNDPKPAVKFKGGSTWFLGKTPQGGSLPYYHWVRRPMSSLSFVKKSEAVVYLENGLS